MIRKMDRSDLSRFVEFSEYFYASAAVLHPIPKEYHYRAFDELMRSNDYIEGYIFECEQQPVGYALTAKSYSHEAGGMMLWIDELYILEEYRSRGLGQEFFEYLRKRLDDKIMRLRLEVELDNEMATALYQKMGFDFLQYEQMYKDVGK